MSKKRPFDRLPKPWQDGINEAIRSVFGSPVPWTTVLAVEAWKDYEAASGLECELDPAPSADNIGLYRMELIAFHAGWEAGRKQ